MRKRSELIFSLILVPIDYFMMVAGFVVAYFVRVGESKPLAFPIGGYVYLDIMIAVLPIWVAIFAMTGLYSLDKNRGKLSELIRIAAASLAGTMILIMIDFFNPQPVFPSKSIPIFGLCFAFLFVMVARQCVQLVQRILYRYGIGIHNVLIFGSNEIGEQLLELEPTDQGVRFMNHAPGFSMPRSIAVLAKLNDEHHLDALVQVISEHAAIKQEEIIQWCHDNHVTYKYIPDLSGVLYTNAQTGLFFGVPSIELPQTPLDGWGRIVKRIVDFITALLALIILSPIYVLIAVLVKILDPGPVFFSHVRLSRAGKKMKVYKFRSMKWKYCDGGPNGGKTPLQLIEEFGRPELVEEFLRDQKLKNDPRVSVFGAFLRHTSLDELPQFYNVLKGDLSLVGPRPIVPSELARYGKRSSVFLAIRPGLTGLWQVSGRNDVSYDERVKLDIYYVENWSLLTDLSILLKTIRVLLRGRGGY